MFSLIAAAAFSLPGGSQTLSEKVLSSLPPEIMRAKPLVVWVELFVGQDGRIEDCKLRAVSGDHTAAIKLCQSMRGLHATPGVGPDGKPMPGVFRTSLAVTGTPLSGAMPGPNLPPDVSIDVHALPEGTGSSLRVGVATLVDESGHVRVCQPQGSDLEDYAKVACEQASALTFPVRQEHGKPVSYLTPLSVEFTSKSG